MNLKEGEGVSALAFCIKMGRKLCSTYVPLGAPKQAGHFLRPACFDFSHYEGFEGRQEKLCFSQVGGLYRRLDSPRLGLSTVRAAQGANPSIRAKFPRRLLSAREFVMLEIMKNPRGAREEQSDDALPRLRLRKRQNPSIRLFDLHKKFFYLFNYTFFAVKMSQNARFYAICGKIIMRTGSPEPE